MSLSKIHVLLMRRYEELCFQFFRFYAYLEHNYAFYEISIQKQIAVIKNRIQKKENYAFLEHNYAESIILHLY
jgi:hypothetical protein